MNTFREKSDVLILGTNMSHLAQFGFNKNFPQGLSPPLLRTYGTFKKSEKSNESV